MTDFDYEERSRKASRFDGREKPLRCRSVTRRAAVAVALALALALGAACARKPFVESLSCGMTRDEVARAAKEHGYDKSFQSWLTRTASDPASKSKELELADLTFRNGRLVAVRQGTYDPRSKKISYRTINLCEKSK